MQNEFCLEDCESSDWMSLVPSSVNNIPLGPSVDEVEELGTGNCQLLVLKIFIIVPFT